MLDIGNYLAEYMPFIGSGLEKEARFTNAGFDNQSFIVGSADVILTFLLTFIVMLFQFSMNKLRKFLRKE